MNFKVRFQNRVFVAALCAAIVSFVYYLLDMFGVAPAITQNKIVEVINMILEILTMIGVFVDPTVDGLYDSSRAMTYNYPAVNIEQEKDLKV